MNRLLGSLCGLLFAGLLMAPALAQNPTAVRPKLLPVAPVSTAKPATAATPAKVAAPADAATVQPDYRAELEKARARNKQLRAENDTLRAQLVQWTSKEGSRVLAYCETPTMSANSAGARNDCASAGYTCEPVSGLCRTSAANGSQCAGSRIWCVYGNRCVTSAAECKP
jgi:hypothetical protein